MMAGLGRGVGLAGIGAVAGIALVAAIYGGGDVLKRVRSAVNLEPRTAAEAPAGAQTGGKPEAEKPGGTGDRAAIDPAAEPPASPGAGPRGETGTQAGPDAAAEDASPSLDIVRVEPSGEIVIAGRAAPNTAVEVLRDDQPIARGKTDAGGAFAIVPPALPVGNSEITLRGFGTDGKPVPGRESVAVVVDTARQAKPLVAVSDPDKPTRVLSQPDTAPRAGPDEGRSESARSDVGGSEAADSAPTPGKPGTDEKPAAPPSRAAGDPDKPAAEPVPVKVVSVDAQDGGRLFVSGQAAPGASLHLYLNDTLVASGPAGPDGRIAFTIGRGVRAGGYQVRIDQVERGTGKVVARAQVGFTFPVQLAARDPGVRTTSAPASPAKPGGVSAPEPPVPDTDRSSTAIAPPATAGGAETARSGTGMAGTNGEAAANGATKADARTAADEPGSVFVAEISTARIIRGDSLWQISRRTYGDGARYTVIYDANQDQIRDPDLIYPGQIFVLPRDAPNGERQGPKRG